MVFTEEVWSDTANAVPHSSPCSIYPIKSVCSPGVHVPSPLLFCEINPLGVWGTRSSWSWWKKERRERERGVACILHRFPNWHFLFPPLTVFQDLMVGIKNNKQVCNHSHQETSPGQRWYWRRAWPTWHQAVGPCVCSLSSQSIMVVSHTVEKIIAAFQWCYESQK